MKKNYWRHRNVFVTGATGFLGSWLVKDLVDAGANVSVLMRDIVPQSQLYRSGYAEKVNIVYGDLADYLLVERALAEHQADTIFHLAAQTQVEIANRNPLSTFESNIRGTWNILEACRRTPIIEKVIIASSDKAYGAHKTLPYDETHPLQGQHPYDVSKSAADLIAFSYFKTYRMPVCITRCGNFFGGGDLNFNRIVPGTIRSVLHNEPPLIRSSGKLTRDYLYIEDAAQAYLTLAEKMEDKKIHGQAFNFSTEKPLSVLEVTDLILKLTKSKLKPKILNTAKAEISHQYLSAKKAREVLGWQPQYQVEEAMQKTISWYKEFFNV